MSIPEELYTKIPVDDLVLYAAKRILENNEECTSERLVYECFTLFPKQFCLQQYPEWPDSGRVNKSWWRCRTDKGWLVGSVKEGFRLTPKGERVAAGVAKKLSTGKVREPRRVARPRERFEAALLHIRHSDGFRRFGKNPQDFVLSEMEIRSLLGGTLETPSRVLKQNLHFYLDVAEQYGDHAVKQFLGACKGFLERLLRQHKQGRE